MRMKEGFWISKDTIFPIPFSLPSSFADYIKYDMEYRPNNDATIHCHFLKEEEGEMKHASGEGDGKRRDFHILRFPSF